MKTYKKQWLNFYILLIKTLKGVALAAPFFYHKPYESEVIMRNFRTHIIIGLAVISLTACVTTAENEQYERDQVIAAQSKAMSKSEKTKYCNKLKRNHSKYRAKILPLIWANLSRQKNNKMTYKELKVTWLSVVNLPDADAKLGQEFRFYKRNMLLNLRYGLISKCAWMNQKAV